MQRSRPLDVSPRLVLSLIVIVAAACAPSAPTAAGPASGAARSATVAPSVSVEPATTRAPTSAPTQTIGWARFRSAALGLSFEYPVDASGAPFPACAPRDDPAQRTARVGALAIELTPAAGLSLDQFVDRWIGSPARVSVDQRTAVSIDGSRAILLQYRSGGLNRFGLATFVQRGGDVISFAHDASGVDQCGGVGVFDFALFTRVQGSLRIEPSTVIGETEPYLRLLVGAWRPSGPTVVVDSRPGVGRGHVAIAVPLTGGAAVELVAMSSDTANWDIRPDGSAIVVALDDHCANCVDGPGRIAIADLRSGRARWLTAADGTRPGAAVWSADGNAVYYGVTDAASADLGIFRINADGSGRMRVTDPQPVGFAAFGQRTSSASPLLLTPDGLLFWASSSGASSKLRVRDLASGSDRAFVTDDQCIFLESWRQTASSSLVRHGDCQAGNWTVETWDVRTGGQTVLVRPPQIGFGADSDPESTLVAVAVGDFSRGQLSSQIVIVSGSSRSPVPDTTGASLVRWLSAGIAYLASSTVASGDCVFGVSEIRFLPAAAGPSKTLYRACALGHLRKLASD